MQSGMLSVEQLSELAHGEQIETVVMAFTDMYGRFMGKRVDVDHFLQVAAQSGIAMCDYMFAVDMDMNTMSGYAYSNWEKGFGDVILKPDFSTLRIASWEHKSALVICHCMDEEDDYVPLAPRSMLDKQIQQLHTMGFSAKAASELEYHSFKNSYAELAKDGYHHLEPIGWYVSDYHLLQGAREEVINDAARHHVKHSGIPVENTKGECGIGQHEFNLLYSDVGDMADRHVILKECIKEIADEKGLSVSFMAKHAEDAAGSSCHVHLSLWQQGQNAFCGNTHLGSVQCSDVFSWFLAGWIKYVNDFMVFYAPTINSYKRYQTSSWAPTTLAWGVDNRTTGFRVVGKDSDNLRIECRIPGADCNPYLVYTAILASGMAGIKNKIEPPNEFTGNAYTEKTLPATLAEALECFKQSEFVTQALGQEVKDHYIHFYELEIEAYNKAVTDWERQRYFERI